MDMKVEGNANVRYKWLIKFFLKFLLVPVVFMSQFQTSPPPGSYLPATRGVQGGGQIPSRTTRRVQRCRTTSPGGLCIGFKQDNSAGIRGKDTFPTKQTRPGHGGRTTSDVRTTSPGVGNEMCGKIHKVHSLKTPEATKILKATTLIFYIFYPLPSPIQPFSNFLFLQIFLGLTSKEGHIVTRGKHFASELFHKKIFLGPCF